MIIKTDMSFAHKITLFALWLIPFLFPGFMSCENSKPVISAELKEKTEPAMYSLTLIAAGDNILHDPISETHKQGNTYNFSPIYSEVKSIIKAADLAFINQETVMAGESYGYHDYPRFNTPQSLAVTLAGTGFDIINLANNHAFDMGRDGLYATLEFLDTIDELTVIGARKTGESAYIITKNNIILGFLAYTYWLNGFVLPPDEPNLVSIINREKMSEEINALRPLCDFLIVSLHSGAEYKMEPDQEKINLANFLAQHNVDLIIGHHPHVLQRVEKLLRPDGKKTLCFYSLGNFVSLQRKKERILGALMLVTFTKSGENLYISDSGIIPTICHFEQGFRNTKVYPFYAYTEELLEKHWCKARDKEIDFEYFDSVLNSLETKLIMSYPQ